MITKKYICPVCNSKCPMCDDEYQCFECEKLEDDEKYSLERFKTAQYELKANFYLKKGVK